MDLCILHKGGTQGRQNQSIEFTYTWDAKTKNNLRDLLLMLMLSSD